MVGLFVNHGLEGLKTKQQFSILRQYSKIFLEELGKTTKTVGSCGFPDGM
jgi:hypothetical protein